MENGVIFHQKGHFCMANLTDTSVNGDLRVTGTMFGTQAGNYATCATAAGTAAKAVTISGFALTTGIHVFVKFTVTNTAAVASLTLDVSGTGAKSLKYRGGNLPAVGTLASGRVYEFVYDGTNWELVGDLDTNTQTVTGVKGNAETTYRTGQVNITPANIGVSATSTSVTVGTTTASIPQATSTSPKMNGTAAVGSETTWAKGDHVHPTDTSRVPTTRTVNGHALSADVTVTAADVSAVRYDTNAQGLTDTQKGNARTNIGAGTSNLTLGTTSTTAAKGDHTHTTSIASDSSSGTVVTLAHDTQYKLTAGGTSVLFKTPADSNTDTKVTQTADDSSTGTGFEVLFSATADNTTRTEDSRKSSKLTFQPSTGTLTATKFSGPLTGNVTGDCSGSSGSCTGNSATATSAGKLTTARKAYVTLGTASTTTTVDWSADPTTIPVNGTLGVGNGGTGKTTKTAAEYNILSKATTALTGEPADNYRFLFGTTTPNESNGVIAGYRTAATILSWVNSHLTGKAATAGTADQVANNLTLKIKTGSTEGTDLYTYNGSGAKTLDIKQGSNITLTAAAGSLTIAGTADTKNTAGSTDTSSKIFLIGATSQAANPQTYSQDTTYVDTDATLASTKVRVAEKCTLQFNSTTNALDFVFS